LVAGTYSVEARASLDGVHWSDSVGLSVSVLAPWYRTWWAFGLFALALVGLGAALHRARLSVETRLGRQRTRIARDLHDDLGSGLGSIGILAGVASGPNLGDEQRRSLAATIAETAHELSGGLSDLVWSLSPRPVTMSMLAAHLADRGSRLVPGPQPRLEVRFPAEFPPVDLPPLFRRNVALIALEAIRNAVRHAHAGRIWLALEPAGKSTWLMEVGDDGGGPTDAGAPGTANGEGGHGRENMRTRAAEIRAALEWSSVPGRGTVVRLRFHPPAAFAVRMNMRWSGRL
jgi:signal transduction histidine kinase